MDKFEFLDDHIQHLIISYLEGGASDEEILQLQQWLAQAGENFTLFAQFRENWLQAGLTERYPVGEAWEKMERQLAPRLIYGRKSYWYRWAGYAAAVVLLFSAGYLWMNRTTVQNEPVAVADNIEPGSKRAVLILGSDQKVVLDNQSEDSIFSGQTNVKREGNTLVYEDGPQLSKNEEYNRLITPRGGEYSVVLSDGTKVWLNAESELRYPVQFSATERKVYLKGEAYFSVTRHEGQNFVVCSDKARITVYGTEFNVRNYGDNSITTTLVKGVVNVRHEIGKECRLAPGQQAVVNDAGDLRVQQVDTELYTAWKDGYFIYRDKTLEDILKELSRWYDFTYFYQGNILENMKLTAKLRKFDSVDKIFEILSATGRLGFLTKGKTVTVVAK